MSEATTDPGIGRSRAVWWRLAFVFIIAMPLAAALPVVGVIYLHYLISFGFVGNGPREFCQSLMTMALPIAALISPIAFYRYLRMRAPLEMTPARLAEQGLLLGTVVPGAVVLLASLLSVFHSEMGILQAIALGYLICGVLLGPLVAIIFGPILRRIDPRYR